MTPFELRALANFRRRGQAPELAVFVMDDWQLATRLMDEIGVLAIRVQNARDYGHDWTPVAGLWVYLWLRRAACSDLADFSTAILSANPARLSTKIADMPTVTVWDADEIRGAA